MKNTMILSLVLLVFGAMLLSNCASLTGFADGRTVGKGNGEFSASLNFSQTPRFRDFTTDSVSVNDKNFRLTFPSLEFGGRYGVAERVDIGLRVNTNFNIAFDGKFQVLGDRHSMTALSVGAGVGTFSLIASGIGVGLWNFQIPVNFSVHPSDNFTWYLAPRFIGQFGTFAGETSSLLKYTGANTGLLFGQRNKFGFDIGYYRVGAGGDSVGLVQFGFGGKFTFGNNDGDSSSSKKPYKRR